MSHYEHLAAGNGAPQHWRGGGSGYQHQQPQQMHSGYPPQNQGQYHQHQQGVISNNGYHQHHSNSNSPMQGPQNPHHHPSNNGNSPMQGPQNPSGNGGRGGYNPAVGRAAGGGFPTRGGGGRGGPGGRGFQNGRAGVGGAGGYHHHSALPPSAGTIDDDEKGDAMASLQVLDMGLDFKSYSHLVGANGQPLLGNVFNFNADEVAEAFEPTVGLFVTLLHLAMTSHSMRIRRSWVTTYQVLQKVFSSNLDPNHEVRQYAEDAVRLIGSTATVDDRLFEKLFQLLDAESEMSGIQAPSQRRVQRDPRGTFCNLHLASDKKCNQDFACNQLHLIKSGGDTVKHRLTFYTNLASELALRAQSNDGDIAHRLRDAIFFAKYGNRVTLRYGGNGPQGGWVHFFKTAYTQGRLSLALRQGQAYCAQPPGTTCRNGATCLGVHLQDRQPTFANKQVDLHQSMEAMDGIEIDVQRVLGMVAQRQANAAHEEQVAASAAAATTGQQKLVPQQKACVTGRGGGPGRGGGVGGQGMCIAPPAALGVTPNSVSQSPRAPPVLDTTSVSSPTTRSWAEAVKEFKHISEKGHPGHHDGTKDGVESTDSSLLASLQTRPPRTPTTPDGATPLLAEINQKRFDDTLAKPRSKE